MTDRFADTFASARVAGRKLLCPFLTAGYPSLPATVDLLHAVQRVAAGGHIGCVELGIPFSDPIADGPTIQASYTHALAQGVNVDGVLAAVAQARAAGVEIPIMAMVSFSIIFKRGARSFAQASRAAGIDGVVLPDVPLEEAPAIVDTLRAAGLKSTLLIAPTTPPERRAQIARLCDGFVYYLSVAGITGERRELPPDLVANVAEIRTHTNAPVCVGFGIATAAHVRQVLQVADGAIVGSALVRRVTELRDGRPAELAAGIETLVRSLAEGAR